MLLSQLPQESKFIQATAGEVARWDRKDHRMADILEALIQLNHNYCQAHTKRRIKAAKPLKRPGFADPAAAGERKLTGKAIPLSELKKLTERWRNGGELDA